MIFEVSKIHYMTPIKELCATVHFASWEFPNSLKFSLYIVYIFKKSWSFLTKF